MFLPTSHNQAVNGGGGNRTRERSHNESPRKADYSYVYLVQDETGPIKIGIADSPEQRLASLQVGNPRQLRLLTVIQTWKPREHEAQIHKHFAEHRIRGEWFHPHPDLLAFVERQIEQEWAQIDALNALSARASA